MQFTKLSLICSRALQMQFVCGHDESASSRSDTLVCVCVFNVTVCLQMPQLKPETISMTGLNLFQHLCNLARLATSSLDNASSCEVHTLL